MKKRIVMFLAAAMAAMCATAEPVVSNETAKQRYPWNGLVDIACTVSGINGTTNGLYFALAAVMPDSGNVRIISHFRVVNNGMYLTDRKVRVNGDYRLVWDAQAELGAVIYSNMVMRVTLVDHDKVQLWADGPYWATTNIGADEPYEYGYHFWWGDTLGYKREGNAWVASDGSKSNFSFEYRNTWTYCKSSNELKNAGWITENNVLAPMRDAAHKQWGGGWRMPTWSEWDNLNDKCDWIWATTNGINGYIVRGRGNYASASIFLPAAGYGDGTSFRSGEGKYWSSVPYFGYNGGNYYYDAGYLFFGSARHAVGHGYRERFYGRSVRPVQGFTK